MSRTRYDYVQLEQEFIRGKMSVRELARLHDIPQERVSSIHLQAKKPDGQGRTWYDKRIEFGDKATNKTMTVLADREAARRVKEADVVDHALDLIDEAILSATQTAKLLVEVQQPDGASHFERKYRIGIRDVSTLIDRLNLLMGRAPAGAEEGINFGANVNVNVDGESELGLIALERLAGISRGRSGPAHARPVGGGALPDAEGARAN